MKTEHPILFTGAMVRAILDGRKTQTRRIIKPQPPRDVFRIEVGHVEDYSGKIMFGFCGDHNEWKFPYGKIGDRLWLRETFHETDYGYSYRADGEMPESARKAGCKWKPSIFMPREASRITLEIVSVRVERLNDISEEDAKAEGCVPQFWPSERVQLGKNANYRAGYAQLWESINGPGSWAKNPYVWVTEFKKV